MPYVHTPDNTLKVLWTRHDIVILKIPRKIAKDTLDSEMVINDEDLGNRFVYPRKKADTHILCVFREHGKVAGVLFCLNLQYTNTL